MNFNKFKKRFNKEINCIKLTIFKFSNSINFYIVRNWFVFGIFCNK